MSYNKKAAEASAPFIEGKNFFDGKKNYPQSYVEAFYHFSEALASDETNSEIYCYRGRCLMSQGYFIEALFDFSCAIKYEVQKQDEAKNKGGDGGALKISLEDPKKKQFSLADYRNYAG